MRKCTTCDIDDILTNRYKVRSLGHRLLKNGINEVHCYDCGRKWKAINRYKWWPIKFAWAKPLPGVKHNFFDWHGIQVGVYDFDARLFAQVFHVGRLRIILGRKGQ